MSIGLCAPELMMTSSSSIPTTTTTTTNVNASLLNYNGNNTSESNLSVNRRHTHHEQRPCRRPDSLSVTISTIPICNLQSSQAANASNDDDELHQFYPGTSTMSTAPRTKSYGKRNIGNYVQSKFNAFVGSITGGGATNKRHRYNGNSFGVIDANNMALSCTAADEEIAPLSPNRAERIIRNEQINRPTNMEFMEQRAELLKGNCRQSVHISCPLLFPFPRPVPNLYSENQKADVAFAYFVQNPCLSSAILADFVDTTVVERQRFPINRSNRSYK